MRRVVGEAMIETLTVPVHGQLDIGTVRAILRQASRFIPEYQLRQHFYSE